MRLSARVLVGWAIVVLLIAAPALVADGARTPYAIPGHGSLSLTFPTGWRVATKSTQQPASVYLRCEPDSGKAFSLQITAVWLDAEKLGKATPDAS